MASQPILLTNRMRLFVAVTDNEWFRLHASKETVEEVNFWRPLSEANFKALAPGELLLFKRTRSGNHILPVWFPVC